MSEPNVNPVLVAVGHDPMDAALAYAVGVAKREGCGLHLLHVLHHVAQGPEMVLVDIVDLEHAARSVVAAAEERARDLMPDDLPVTTQLRVGWPGHVDRGRREERPDGRPPAPSAVAGAACRDPVHLQRGGRPRPRPGRVGARAVERRPAPGAQPPRSPSGSTCRSAPRTCCAPRSTRPAGRGARPAGAAHLVLPRGVRRRHRVARRARPVDRAGHQATSTRRSPRSGRRRPGIERRDRGHGTASPVTP